MKNDFCKCGHDRIGHAFNSETGTAGRCNIFTCNCQHYERAMTEADCKAAPVTFSKEIIPMEETAPGSIVIFCLDNTINLQSRNLSAYETKRILKEMIRKIG